MPSEPSERVHDLEDFVTFLQAALQEGFEFVGAYGRLRGRELLTADLDILATYPTLCDMLEWAQARGAVIHKRPVARNIPVAFRKEINILASALGLPAPEGALRLGRVVRLSRHGNLGVPLADPFDLLRAKDQPHNEFLQEVVDDFTREEEPRQRLAGARRLLGLLGTRKLPGRLAARLVPLARTPADFRFLANAAPEPEPVLAAARERAPELVEGLLALLQRTAGGEGWNQVRRVAPGDGHEEPIDSARGGLPGEPDGRAGKLTGRCISSPRWRGRDSDERTGTQKAPGIP